MPPDITEREFRLFRELIEKLCGVALQENKAYLVRNRLAGILAETNCDSFMELYDKVRGTRDGHPLRCAVVDAITTHETYWFRDPKQFDLMKNRLLPMLRDAMKSEGRDTIRIWSAACATGQEPYSVAMTAMEVYATSAGPAACAREVNIVATDISPRACEATSEGLYNEPAMSRGLSDEMRERHFRRDGERWGVVKRLKDLVTVSPFNLLDEPEADAAYDLVLLRNVVIYFAEDVKPGLFERITNTLRPGGFLLLGTGESAVPYAKSLERLEMDGVTLYRRPETER